MVLAVQYIVVAKSYPTYAVPVWGYEKDYIVSHILLKLQRRAITVMFGLKSSVSVRKYFSLNICN